MELFILNKDYSDSQEIKYLYNPSSELSKIVYNILIWFNEYFNSFQTDYGLTAKIKQRIKINLNKVANSWFTECNSHKLLIIDQLIKVKLYRSLKWAVSSSTTRNNSGAIQKPHRKIRILSIDSQEIKYLYNPSSELSKIVYNILIWFNEYFNSFQTDYGLTAKIKQRIKINLNKDYSDSQEIKYLYNPSSELSKIVYNILIWFNEYFNSFQTDYGLTAKIKQRIKINLNKDYSDSQEIKYLYNPSSELSKIVYNILIWFNEYFNSFQTDYGLTAKIKQRIKINLNKDYSDSQEIKYLYNPSSELSKIVYNILIWFNEYFNSFQTDYGLTAKIKQRIKINLNKDYSDSQEIKYLYNPSSELSKIVYNILIWFNEYFNSFQTDYGLTAKIKQRIKINLNKVANS
ncbi:hypothetical protein FQR65_LT11647 [Abscondita terminalis]|nr:hypothetical protein FQR65_LT11647 [Abscondita terminalis]